MKQDITKRFNRIRGQCSGLEKMIAENRNCLEVLNQLSAIRSALDSLGLAIINQETACLKIKKNEHRRLDELLNRFVKNKLT